MKGRYGPALLKIINTSSACIIERTNLMRRFIRNPQNIGDAELKQNNPNMLHFDAMPLVDEDVGHVGYHIGFNLPNALFYEQANSTTAKHLMKADLPETVLQALVGRRLIDFVTGIEKMEGVWDGGSTITGIERSGDNSYMVVPVPSWPIDHYLGDGARG